MKKQNVPDFRVPKVNKKIVERNKIDTRNTQCILNIALTIVLSLAFPYNTKNDLHINGALEGKPYGCTK